MDALQERATNQAAYRRMKGTLVATYGEGQFVAFSNGGVAADADSFVQLRDQLAALGSDPAEVLIVQAGVDYPETAVIFSVEPTS